MKRDLGGRRVAKRVGSRVRTVVGLTAASVLVLAGVALVAVPASATVTLQFSNLPTFPVTAGNDFGFTVTATTGASVTVTSNCDAQPSANLTETATGGTATFSNVYLETAGTACTLSASDNMGDTAASTSAFTVTPGAAYELGFTTAPPTSAQADSALTTFRVSSEDKYGNATGSGTDNITIDSSCSLGGTVTEPEVAGVATFSALTINSVGTCYLTANDVSNTGIAPVTTGTPVTVSGGTPTHLAFKIAPPATELSLNTALTSFEVAVEDVNNNIDITGTGSNNTITISSSNCTLGGTVTEAAVAGVATFSDVTFTSTGDCTLTATDDSLSLAVATATVTVGEPQTPAVTVTSLTGYADAPLTLTSSGGEGTGAVTFTVTNGTATDCAITNGVLSVKKAGTCLVTATKAASSTYAPASSAATTVTFSSLPKAVRLSGTVTIGRKSIVTVSGYNFSGRPKVISNVAGFKALVNRDTGKSLEITIEVTGKPTPGVKVMTIILANGERTSLKYSLH